MQEVVLRFVNEAKMVLVEDFNGDLISTYFGVSKVQEEKEGTYIIVGGKRKLRLLGRVQNVVGFVSE